MQSLNTELTRVLNTLAPEKEKRISLKAKHPWYDQEMKKLKWKVGRLEKKWLRYKLDSCWMAYKKAQNSYYHKLNIKKKDTIRAKINDCTNDSRKLHKLINNLTKPREEQPWSEHKDKESLANEFASYFEDKILKIRKVLETTPPYTAEQQAVPRLTKLAPMTEEEVHKVIVSLKTKSCELDTMPTDILKKMMPVVLPLITKIINLSLTQGDFCRSWKTAVVQPLLKKLGLQLIHSNYRPVSNLTFISKVIERCMLLQLSQHCTTHNLQPDYQPAYRENYSCETAILHVSNDILWAMENQSITSLIVMDLSATFNTVDHKILLTILKCKFGLEHEALKWFDRYLFPRSYKVIINGKYSREIDLSISVPQVSCAGANIFNLYCTLLH